MTNATRTLLLPNQVDEILAAHFAALGVGTIAAYKLWCHRHGLSTALDKSPQEHANEQALFASLQPSVDPAASKEHNPRRAALIRRLFNGELENEKLNDLLSRLRVERNALASDPDAQKALGGWCCTSKNTATCCGPCPCSSASVPTAPTPISPP